MKIKQLLSAFACLFLLIGPAQAEDSKYGTKDEAVAMATKAAELLREDEAKAFAAFQDKSGEFVDRDLYVFVFDKDGMFKAHGDKPVLVGKSGLNMNDVEGFAFVKAFLEVKDTGWVNYKWPDLLDNGAIKEKTTYVVRVGEYALGVGYYENP